MLLGGTSDHTTTSNVFFLHQEDLVLELEIVLALDELEYDVVWTWLFGRHRDAPSQHEVVRVEVRVFAGVDVPVDIEAMCQNHRPRRWVLRDVADQVEVQRWVKFYPPHHFLLTSEVALLDVDACEVPVGWELSRGATRGLEDFRLKAEPQHVNNRWWEAGALLLFPDIITFASVSPSS